MPEADPQDKAPSPASDAKSTKPDPDPPVSDDDPTPVPDSPVSAPPPPDSEHVHSQPIDMVIFNQILELDDDGTHDFSKDMVSEYFLQAAQTFTNMDKALADKELHDLSSLGHFLKGSSAALGLRHVQAACEKMQLYGDLRADETAAAGTLTEPDALARIEVLLPEAKAEYAEAKRWLEKFYAADLAQDDDAAAAAAAATEAPKA
ncbi:histidine-phosphotransfer domain HPT domain-containing protein [Mycena pura]|uniref:Histidine-phosphotransfer domain HPT domain-containing protein n=1 Tax=Mycena pura TaxID=153505 RepID=A0AAD6V538_9AGAR|nr:histidine-phosphotransfer domain HPT domain-containing protein [Mycena pura]